MFTDIHGNIVRLSHRCLYNIFREHKDYNNWTEAARAGRNHQNSKSMNKRWSEKSTKIT